MALKHNRKGTFQKKPPKKPRSAAQKAATARMIAAAKDRARSKPNKRRKRSRAAFRMKKGLPAPAAKKSGVRRKRRTRSKRKRTPAQIAATERMLAARGQATTGSPSSRKRKSPLKKTRYAREAGVQTNWHKRNAPTPQFL